MKILFFLPPQLCMELCKLEEYGLPKAWSLNSSINQSINRFAYISIRKRVYIKVFEWNFRNEYLYYEIE